MKSKLIIFLDCFRTYKCGVDTYISEFTEAFRTNSRYKFLHLILYSPEKVIKRVRHDRVESVSFPNLKDDFGLLICSFIHLIVPDNEHNIFLVNFYPCSSIVFQLKKLYKHSKVICVVHDFKWAKYTDGQINSHLFGNSINNFLTGNKDNVSASIMDGKIAFSYADGVITLCKRSYNILDKFCGIPALKMRIIPNGLRDFYTPNVNYSSQIWPDKKNKRFLFVGKLTHSKGADILYNAFLHITAKYPDVELILVGHLLSDCTFREQLQTTCSNNIKWLGECNQAELIKLYLQTDFGIIPSLYEQCSYVGIEMKCFALPIISTNVMGLSDMFNPHNSIICEPTTSSIITAVEFALSLSIPEIHRLRCQSRKDYQDRYCSKIMETNYSNFFNSMPMI